MQTISGIYTIDFGSGNYYVGSSKNLSQRRISHLSKLRLGKSNCKVLQLAFNKHGEESFTFTELVAVPHRLLREVESTYIRLFDSYNNGYNATTSTDLPMLGRKHKESTKSVMSAKAKGNKGRTGKPLSLEHRRKIGLGNKGKKVKEGFHKGASNPSSKITTKEVEEILKLKGKKSQTEIGKIYGISQQQVSKIQTKKRWV